ncbi:MAG: Arm DNA-binding domain-containing protein [Candidatus Limiplasma sp.]|nr:Arm DNA-binding domain-containing protein [Candidatus Limiplasma sp.]
MPTISLRKRSNGWEYRFETASIDGKRKQHTKSGYLTKKEAELAGTEAYTGYT